MVECFSKFDIRKILDESIFIEEVLSRKDENMAFKGTQLMQNRHMDCSVGPTFDIYELSLNEYQSSCYSTAIYPQITKVIYPLLGLFGEIGEIAEKTRDYLFPNGCPSAWDNESMFLKEIYHKLDDMTKVGLSAGKTSKMVRDKNNQLDPRLLELLESKVKVLSDEQKENLGKELMDAVWFIATALGDLGIKFGDAAQQNLDKLQKRKKEGKIGGDGDNR